MEPLFLINEKAVQEYKDYIAENFKKALPYFLLAVNVLAYERELNNMVGIAEGAEEKVKQVMRIQHLAMQMDVLGILPDDYVSAEEWQERLGVTFN